ncbi:peroxiredoxin [Actinocrinis puniceicyclus]|uniref:Alkyl hydroperoxide reductase E n=1 Tax=Actinocrinis puniceicyclus TaxID=977794 RepID=A0A8J7WP11_9ACTN|nr:peroxiredoxin [Actinocrinis puniceicyclus]MBS2965986.1 peroxiredoxin [Actinocrinis puniceicyclus]
MSADLSLSSADAPADGFPAPDFTLTDQHGVDCSLSDELKQRPVLVVFYPYAFSRICGGELRELQASLGEFEGRGISVFAVSCDPMFSLRVYAEQEGFTFPLLSDFWPHGGVARAYGVFDETKGCALRGSFLIGQDGVVQWSVVNPISEGRPLSAYLDALTAH